MAYHVIGISAHFHDSACCLLSDGVLVAAAQEERFTRRKHEPGIPKLAFKYCLDEGGLSIADVDHVAYYEQPYKKLGRQIWTLFHHRPPRPEFLARLDPRKPEREIRAALGFEGPITCVDHHQAHAASAYYFSGFDEAAILTVDGVGEWATTTYGRARGAALDIFEAVDFPHSLGLFYSTMTSYLGFEVNDGEYKVMGLAPYGRPIYADVMRQIVQPGCGGQYRLDLELFDFAHPDRMFSDELIALLGRPPRRKGEKVESFHCDLARSVQGRLEEILLEKADYLHERTRTPFLCLAGGVALNCVANGRIAREGPFDHLFVQPAASDAGGCLGAAVTVHCQTRGDLPRPARLDHVFLGPDFATDEIASLVDALGVRAMDYRGREDALVAAVAERLAAGKVIGWFCGRMEFGPRSLGARSILADPRQPTMRDRINALVKKRESFRPFAPAVLATRSGEHFDLDHASPFMLETCQVHSPLALPAITHVDNSARVQTVDESTSPRFAALLDAFDRRTDCPMLLNTSFNLNDEPIVCTPTDALLCFLRSTIDTLVLEEFVIDRSALGPSADLLFQRIESVQGPAIVHGTYTLF
jgi:carbamoyltransferase